LGTESEREREIEIHREFRAVVETETEKRSGAKEEDKNIH